MISPDVRRAYALDREGGERLRCVLHVGSGAARAQGQTRDEGAAATVGLFQDR